MLSLYRPLFLWGLLALAVPILIHALNRRRTIELDFSTLRFFKATALRASKMRRLKRLLLLIIRCLIIIATVVLFAKPRDAHDPFSGFSDPNAELYSWVDPTPSMTYKDNGLELRQKANALLDSLNGKLPVTSRHYRFSYDRGEFIGKDLFDLPKDGRLGYARPSIDAMMRDLRIKIKRSTGAPMLLLFSDFQENISGAFDGEFSSNAITFPILCISMAPQNPWNFGIKKVYIPRERPGSVVGSVFAQGHACKDAALSVFAGSMRLARTSMSVNRGERAFFNLDIASERLQRAGLARLDNDDPFPADNVFYFSINDRKNIRVLIVGDSIKSFPIAAALRSLGKESWDPVIVRQPQSVGYDDVDSADCIVLNEAPFIPRAVQALFHSRLSPKAFVYSPDMEDLTRLSEMTAIAGMKKGRPLSCSIVDKPLSIIYPDTVSFLWKGFHESSGREAAIDRLWSPLPGEALLKVSDGRPFAVRVADSLGNSWVVFAAPIGLTETNNLCKTGIFLPLLDRIIRYSLESIHKNPEGWVAGMPQRNPFLGTGESAIIYNEKGEFTARWDNQPSVAFEEPGIYKVQPAREASYIVAVNQDTAESDFSYRFPHIPPTFKRLVHTLKSGEFISILDSEKRPGFNQGLWVCIAVFILAESLLWERTEKKKKPGL